MCVCCPALRSRSRQPVKRYRKLLAEIFPKSIDGPPNERKIVKLCEYAAKNPFRIPKIAKYLEDRCYKELRNEHIKFINIVTEAYNKLLCMCKEQMAYFAVNLLNVVTELLDNSKHDALRILGCQTLARFIYSQADGTFAHSIENFVHKVCILAREAGREHQKCCLRASGLQCLSAMLWFMAEFSHIFADFDEIVQATLDNYEVDPHSDDDDDDERGETHHNWVDEVVRCEGRGVGIEINRNCIIIRPPPEKRDPSLLTREEVETPKVWAQLCIQRMVELAKESTTMRRILDPMFVYFDIGRHWVPRQGLALVVLSDMSYLMESPGNKQLILASVIRHLDHKNVSHDLQIKAYVVQVAAALASQIRSKGILSEIGVSDLCRHLRKSLQAIYETSGGQELNLNITLQNSIQSCLLEIFRGVADARALFDMMAITLEKLPAATIVARATIRSLLILGHMVSFILMSSLSQQVFPEALLLQLLKVMIHPDVETRTGAHQMFSLLLVPSSYQPGQEIPCLPRKWHSDAPSVSASITALLKKLQREKDGTKAGKNGTVVRDDLKDVDFTEGDWIQGRANKNSPNFYKITSIIDRTTGSNSLADAEPCMMKLTEDQIGQLLSSFWIQANLPDNLPSNVEAIAHSFSLTLLSSRLKNPNDNLVVRFFQLSLSLMNISLDLDNGTLPPACRRSVLTLSTAMLMFAAKLYQIANLNDFLKSFFSYDVDPYLGISDDLQVYVKPQVNERNYASFTDNQVATSSLIELRNTIYESDKVIRDILVQSLSGIIEMDVDDLAKQLFEGFTPDDSFMIGTTQDLRHIQMASHSKESLSFDGDLQTSSFVEDDAVSESSVADLSRFIPKIPPSPSMSKVICIGQLLESALEVAGQVAGTSVSTSPLPYSTMAGHCEALGTVTRRKLSSWLTHDNPYYAGEAGRSLPSILVNKHYAVSNICSANVPVEGGGLSVDPWLAMRLPPASPFDNFLRAAGC